MRTNEPDAFPMFGARARVWQRFERDLHAWLESPEGRFATWEAGVVVSAPESAPESTDR